VICDVGVVNDGHGHLTVKHGVVRQFGLGLLVGTARRNRILGLSASRNLFSGIVLALAFRTVVRNSAFVRNGLHTDQSGIVLFDSHRNRILGNSFRRNGDIGMFVDSSTHNLIKGNLIVRNPEAGINFQHGAANQVRRNRIVRNGDGVLVDDGGGYVIARNRISAPGCRPGCGFGIWVARGHGSLVTGNVVTHADRTGIRVGGANHIVRRNRVRRTGGDGFIVDPGPGRIKLRRNLARGAGDDGFDIASPMAKLISNRAIGNADLGIEAVRGAIDGGGNVASGNGDPFQCTHILCS
jgi:parallel beta-helix repeat protein